MSDYPDQITVAPLPGPFDVALRPPGSKSLTNRALLLAALAQGTSTLTGVLFSDDTRVMMRALEQLGFNLDIDEAGTTVKVEGRGGAIPAKRAELHLGNAGTAMRFLTAACCLGEPGSEYVLDGVPRMRERPIGELVDALRQLGAGIEYLGKEGYPPLKIAACGLTGGEIWMDPSTSSQYVSALMIIGAFAKSMVTIQFKEEPVSFPYIDMTATLIETFGSDHVAYASDLRSLSTPAVQVDRAEYAALSAPVEPDASNASYFLAATAICTGSSIQIAGVSSDGLQGDAGFARECLQQMGAEVQYNEGQNWIGVTSCRALKGIDIDLNAMPDMAQTLAVVACFADGPTTIRNVGNLRVKETDRMAALKTELEKVGAMVTITGDDITITPPPGNKIKAGVAIDTYDDHRMAMAFSILGLVPGGPGITINDPGCVAKTYPGFWDDLQKLRDSAERIAQERSEPAADAASVGAASVGPNGGTPA